MNRRPLLLPALLIFLFPWPWPDARIKPPPIEGWASQYAKGVMSRVVRYRQRQGQLPLDLSGYDGAVARPECADIGKDVWLRFDGGDWERFVVADCGSKSDARESDGLSGYDWMKQGNVLVEVDYPTAERHGFVGRMMWVEILQGNSRRSYLPHVPVRLASPALPKQRPRPYDVEAEALILEAPTGYIKTYGGPLRPSPWLRNLGAVEGYRVSHWSEEAVLYSIAFVFWDADGAHWCLRELERIAEEEGLVMVPCPLNAENIGHQRDMGNGTGFIITFRLGNVLSGTVVTMIDGVDGALLACEFAQDTLLQALRIM